MNIIDTIQADQIESGDQIIVDGDPLEQVEVFEAIEDVNLVVLKGVSQNTGDRETYMLSYDYEVQVWAV